MKINEDTVLVGSKVVLVPYLREHVPKYHSWMQDAELQRLTASEPLSLEEEYEMQQKWHLDEDKLTFIVLAQHYTLEEAVTPPVPEDFDTLSLTDPWIKALPMVGDVNMFLKGTMRRSTHIHSANLPVPPRTARLDTTDDTTEDDDNGFEAELEIMIAEPAYRRKGLAHEALQLILEYSTGFHRSCFRSGPSSDPPKVKSTEGYNDCKRGILSIPLTALVVRISDTNTPSIRLFEMLGFGITRRVQVFEEVEMRFGVVPTTNTMLGGDPTTHYDQ